MSARHYRRRQEISRCLKYLIFFVNFIFWLCGLACTILGVYLYAKDFRAILEAIDFLLNPSILLIVCGCIIFLIAFLGCTGALRENICMLRAFSLCLFFAYVSLVILAFVVFILFYSDTKTGISIHSLLQNAIAKYHENENMREMMDYLQANLGCCGATSQGYKDWNSNQLYNCSSANSAPEQCGVPPSCCKSTGQTNGPPAPSVPPIAVSPVPGANAEAILSTDKEVTTNPRCGFHAQDKAVTELQNTLYTDGCLQLLQRTFEGHAIIIGAVIAAIIVPVCLSVTLSNVLARQVAHQRYLLAKEARKEERRRRRKKNKYKTHSNESPVMTIGADAQLRVARHAMEIASRQAAHPRVLNGQTPAVYFTECEQPPLPHHVHGYIGPPPIYKQKPLGISASDRETLDHSVHGKGLRKKLPKRWKSNNHEQRTPCGRNRHSRLHKNRHRMDTNSRGAVEHTGPIIVELSSTTHDMPPEYRERDEGDRGRTMYKS